MSTGWPGKLIKPDDVEGQIWTPIGVRDISTRRLFHFRWKPQKPGANSIVELRVAKKKVVRIVTKRKIGKEKKKKNQFIFEGWLVVITQKLSVDNVWPSFNGLTGHPTVTSLSAV
jgi:hypothetical protein